MVTLTHCPSCPESSISPQKSVSPIVPNGETMLPDIAGGHKNLKSPEDHLINLHGTYCNLKMSPNESGNYNYSLQEKQSRLAAWKHRKFDSFSSRIGKLDSQLDLGKGEAARAPHTPEGINLETGKLKKSRSVLFRLWSSMTPEQAPVANETRGQPQAGDISITTDQQGLSHPLQVLFTEAARVQKDRQQVPQEGSLQGWQPGNIVLGDTPECDIVNGNRLEASMVKNTGKRLDRGIEQGEKAVAGSTIHSFTSVLSTR